MLTVSISGTEASKDASRHRATVGTCAVAAEEARRFELRMAMADQGVEHLLDTTSVENFGPGDGLACLRKRPRWSLERSQA